MTRRLFVLLSAALLSAACLYVYKLEVKESLDFSASGITHYGTKTRNGAISVTGTSDSVFQVTVTKRSQFLVNVTITWQPSYKEPLLLITTFEGAPRALSTYQRRFGIEPMFKDQKSNGFNLEKTKVTDAKRIETLMILTTFAHIFCTTEGYRKESHGNTKKNGVVAPSSVPLDSS